MTSTRIYDLLTVEINIDILRCVYHTTLLCLIIILNNVVQITTKICQTRLLLSINKK